MRDNIRVGFIGAGNMAFAIANGLAKSGQVEACRMTVLDINPASNARFEAIGCACAADAAALCRASDMLFLAVKPQNYNEALRSLAPHFDAATLVVSIAAGISTDFVRARLPGAMVVRCMPNTPLLVGAGATALCASDNVPPEQFDTACGMFAALGEIARLPESSMNAVISVNGSSPAYVYLLADAMLSGATRQGIGAGAALPLIIQTIEGSAKMLRTGRTPRELIDMVASKGGTTERALAELERHGFVDGVVAAMNACTLRADELAK